MNTIQKCNAYKIKDSRGEETLEVEMIAGEFTAWASVPAGKSTGSREAVIVPVDEAIRKINEIIAPQIIGKKANVFEIDDLLVSLDGTENKSNLGTNAILGVSIATLKLEAKLQNQPLWQYIQLLSGSVTQFVKFPRLFVNVLNGGAHAGFRLPFQEYMFVLGNGMNVAGPINQLQTLFEQLENKLKMEGHDFVMGDEGGFSFKSDDIEEPFKILSELHNKIAIDVAGGEFFEDGKYNILGQKYSSDELSEIYENLVKKFPLISIEDPFAENDFEGFVSLSKKLRDRNWIASSQAPREDGRGEASPVVFARNAEEWNDEAFQPPVSASNSKAAQKSILIVGDDLTTTNPEMIQKTIDEKMINTVLIKPNQIGTVTETLEAIKITHQAGLKTIISHRSGETHDTFIADLAVGVGAYGLKAGTMFQPERKEKYDRLLEIEKEVNKLRLS